jgi:hypothetical protein
VFEDLRDEGGHKLFTPVPANQVDSSRTGYVIGSVNSRQVPEAAFLTVLAVTKDSKTGGAALGLPRTVPLPLGYSVPPPAEQAGTPYPLETLDGRLTQAVGALDPSRLDPATGAPRMAIWTQHTVAASAGGLGSEVRWYEVDPESRSLMQSGIVHDPDLYVYNGAISSDRRVSGGTEHFGNAMALGFNTSSNVEDVAIRMETKVGGGAQSPFQLIVQSAGPNVDATCVREGPCRWGDFAGASPDPSSAPPVPVGSVWFTATYNRASVDDHAVDWRTWNWSWSTIL